MAIIAKFTRTLPAPSATISGGFVFLLSAGWFTQANTGVAGSPIDGGTNSLANGGGDIKIFSDALATTQLPIEVVSFVTGASPVAQVWVRTSSYTSGDTITIGKDDTQTVQPIVSSTYGRNATWADFEVNYHFNSSNDLIDSTGNHDLTEIGTVTSVTGKIGDAVDCSGSYSNRFEATGYKGVTGGSARTLTAWCNNTSSDNRGLATWGSAATAKRWSIWFNGGKFRTEIDGSFRQSTSGSSGAFKRFSSILTGSSFPSNSRHRIDGSTTTGDSVGGAQTVNTGSSSDMKVAAYSNLSSVSHGSNITDELSLRSFAISDDQDLSEYTNQSDPDNFGTSSEWVLVGSSGITITADAGAYSVTGATAILNSQLNLKAITSAYLQNGSNTQLNAQLNITTTSGSYLLTGEYVNLKSAKKLIVESGGYDLTGTGVTLIYTPGGGGDVLVIDTGVYSLAGDELVLKADLKIINESGSYLLSGMNTTIKYGASIALEVGDYSLYGTDLNLFSNYGMIVTSNSYTLTGKTVVLRYSGDTNQIIGTVTAGFAPDLYSANYKPSTITVTFKG